jgi:hypothetical protein
VQGARLCRCSGSGAGAVKLRCGDGLLLLVRLGVVLLFSFSSSSAGAALAEGENRGLLGLGERLGVLYSALGFGERQRLGVLDVRARMRGGIAAVQRGSVADTGGAVVSLPCHGAGTSGARRRPVTRASGGRGGREKRKGGRGGWAPLSRSGVSGVVVELREEEGKADKRAPLVSCPGWKVKGRDDWLGWAVVACGPRGLCTFREKGEEELGWLGLLAHEVFMWLVFEFEFEWPIQIQVPLN